jgi:hypothetical protein
MKNEQATLAMINIMEELAILYKTKHGHYKLSKTASDRVIFQYGDVLSIRKWHALQFLVLRKMTEIGKEDYVNVMMKAYNRFIRVHDYLHENIHRVQFIYKRFYGGILQATQALIGAKNIKFDPTKWPRTSIRCIISSSLSGFFRPQTIRLRSMTTHFGSMSLCLLLPKHQRVGILPRRM